LQVVADRLWNVRERLDHNALKVYKALQLSLQCHRTQASPSFERDFQDHLRIEFSDAWQITTRQIGGWNQWQVVVDGGKPMYCSVRLEVLSDDPALLRELTNKARAIKDTLMEDGGKWKQLIERGASREKLMRFKQECQKRSQEVAAGRANGNNRWVEAKEICQTCGKSTEDDQLCGKHMCVVRATFTCQNCNHSWSSYRGRLRSDNSSERQLIAQMCAQCSGDGIGTDWHANDERDKRPASESDYSSTSKGMHQSELCGACREYGNCKGLFYDPFIHTTALGMCTGKAVKWSPHSDEMPELLIADLGPEFSKLQVYLQPHVYTPPDDEEPLGKYGSAKRPQQTWRKVDRSAEDRMTAQQQRQFLQNQLHQQRQIFYNKRQHNDGVDAFDGATADSQGDPQDGGVKNQMALDRFLKGSGGALPNNSTGPLQNRHGQQQNFAPYAQTRKMQPTPWVEHGDGGYPSHGQPSDVHMAGATGPAVDGLDDAERKSLSFNKIKENSPPSGSSAYIRTPLFGKLPRLRQQQLLQLATRHAPRSQGDYDDSAKFKIVEEYLEKFNGDFDAAYSYLRAL